MTSHPCFGRVRKSFNRMSEESHAGVDVNKSTGQLNWPLSVVTVY